MALSRLNLFALKFSKVLGNKNFMEKAYWLAWSKVNGIGSTLLKRIEQKFGSLETAWSLPASDLQTVDGLGNITVEGIIASRRDISPLALFAEYEQKNRAFWTPADPEYPKLLWEIPDPPPILCHRGNLTTWLERSTVSIVGTRNPTVYGRRWAKKISIALAENGFTVVSGLADGIDAEAHKGCLEAGGNTIAVVGTGVDLVYPSKHQALYQQILQSGLVLSEYPDGTEPDRTHFPQRNRIIAGLCRATIVIEAPDRSGALITAHQANDYGRDVFALPGSLDVKESSGCHSLISRGAGIIMGIDELIESLGTMPSLDRGRLSEKLSEKSPAKNRSTNQTVNQTPSQISIPLDDLAPIQQKILNLLSFSESIGFDRIIEQANFPAGEVSGALLQLELLGAISQSPGMRYQRLI